jgi:hypothetical protein
MSENGERAVVAHDEYCERQHGNGYCFCPQRADAVVAHMLAEAARQGRDRLAKEVSDALDEASGKQYAADHYAALLRRVREVLAQTNDALPALSANKSPGEGVASEAYPAEAARPGQELRERVEALAETWEDQSREWYDEHRYDADKGTQYACGFEDGWGHAAARLRAALDDPR